MTLRYALLARSVYAVVGHSRTHLRCLTRTVDHFGRACCGLLLPATRVLLTQRRGCFAVRHDVLPPYHHLHRHTTPPPTWRRYRSPPQDLRLDIRNVYITTNTYATFACCRACCYPPHYARHTRAFARTLPATGIPAAAHPHPHPRLPLYAFRPWRAIVHLFTDAAAFVRC